MNDLNSLDWSAPPKNANSSSAPSKQYHTLLPSSNPQNFSPNTPSVTQHSGNCRLTPGTPATPKTVSGDSFSNLVSFGSSKQTDITLRERQEQLEVDRRKQEEKKKKQFEAQFSNDAFWNEVGSKSPGDPLVPYNFSKNKTNKVASTSLQNSPIPRRNVVKEFETEESLFKAFNYSTTVDNSSHYPPPSMTENKTPEKNIIGRKQIDLSKPEAWNLSQSLSGAKFEDDDPFGLAPTLTNNLELPSNEEALDDDFLGNLGKPVEYVKKLSSNNISSTPISNEDDPMQISLAKLVDMGFTEEQSRRALSESGSGLDTQAAVSWILNDAHKQTRKIQVGKDTSSTNITTQPERKAPYLDNKNNPTDITWMSDERHSPSRSKLGNIRLSNDNLDISKAAVAVSSNLLKTANSLWKNSQKKVQKAVAEFQHQDSDPNHPRWMRDAPDHETVQHASNFKGSLRSRRNSSVTDEALLLEIDGDINQRKLRSTETKLSFQHSSRERSTSNPRLPSELSRSSARSYQFSQSNDVYKKDGDDIKTEKIYVSPARRRIATIHPQPTLPKTEPTVSVKPSKLSNILHESRQTPSSTLKSFVSKPCKPNVPARQLPDLSSKDLQISTQHRIAGTSHFKRGDYASAHLSYSSSISALPSSHPIIIVLLCNRALTSLKTGLPKSAVSDANIALDLIGESRGDTEVIDLGPGESGGIKNMREYYGKALMRKAEALEQMEHWKDAAEVWKNCVEQGIGGSTAVQGRTRCEKSSSPQPLQKTRNKNTRIIPVSNSRITTEDPDSVAVKKLREANKQAEKLDHEKSILSEKVEARVDMWRNGKLDNLRALIGSLDAVMWEGSDWKKVGMHELVQNNRVKINYMKAISKTHPDKLPQNASTEVRMIAALIFATLNESWDKFRQQNGL
ncbi:BgTH12-07567 [Blumeria graminis f. sp. triticale]|uniref:BgTH12-07567 n=1 Tax=Blumeria graminis f. sp. triticale TaxID=1689686 RepID=A0A9W4GE09_BLUGR|nr:BgTH12-07567 [Blumeria graminis f. sp. triticale]